MDDQVPEIDILCRHLESLLHTVVYRSKTTNQPHSHSCAQLSAVCTYVYGVVSMRQVQRTAGLLFIQA
jgi:hypothetical protein